MRFVNIFHHLSNDSIEAPLSISYKPHIWIFEILIILDYFQYPLQSLLWFVTSYSFNILPIWQYINSLEWYLTKVHILLWYFLSGLIKSIISCARIYTLMLGGSHFFWEPSIPIIVGAIWELPWLLLLFNNKGFKKLTWVLKKNFKKLTNFQSQWFSQTK
jgi:hypothetical protein